MHALPMRRRLPMRRYPLSSLRGLGWGSMGFPEEALL
jgi:hypothetical protein